MKLYTVDSVGLELVRLLLRQDESIQVEVARHELPGVQEGDIISAEIEGAEVIRFAVEEEETKAARARILAKLNKLKNRPD